MKTLIKHEKLFRLLKFTAGFTTVTIIIKQFLLPFLVQKILNLTKISVLQAKLRDPMDNQFLLEIETELLGIPIPFGLDIQFSLPLRLVYKQTDGEEECGTLTIPGKARIPSSRLLSLCGTVDVALDGLLGFAKFAKNLLLSESPVFIDMVGKGVGLIVCGSHIGNLTIQKSIALQGLGGLKKTRVEKVEVIGGTRDHILLKVDATITNISTMELISLGKVCLSMYYKDCELAEMNINDFSLFRGENKFTIIVKFKIPKDGREQGLQVLSKFCCGIQSEIVIRGAQQPSEIPFLVDALHALNIKTILPGYPIPLLKRVKILISSPLSLLVGKVPNILLIENSFGTKLTIFRISGSVYSKSSVIGHIEQEIESGIEILPKTTTWTPTVWLNLSLGMGVLRVGQELRVDVDCVLDVMVGEYMVKGVNYNQAGVELGVGVF